MTGDRGPTWREVVRALSQAEREALALEVLEVHMKHFGETFRRLSWGIRDCCGGSDRQDLSGHQPWCREVRRG